METSPGIQLIWTLAAQEALAANFREIGVIHAFNAVLKFAELDDSSLKHIVKGGAAFEVIMKEKATLTAALETRMISVNAVSAPLRRLLRKEIGDGGHPFVAGGEVHRSAELKKMFSLAEERAQRSFSPTWSSLHLLEAILQEPPAVLLRLLPSPGYRAPREEDAMNPQPQQTEEEPEIPPFSDSPGELERFTPKAVMIIDRACNAVLQCHDDMIELEVFVNALAADGEASVRLADCLTGGDLEKIQYPGEEPVFPRVHGPYPGYSEEVRVVLGNAAWMAQKVPDASNPGLIDMNHMVAAVSVSPEACRLLGGQRPIRRESAVKFLAKWYAPGKESLTMSDLVKKMRGLRADLLSHIFGQEHAVHTFMEGMYNAQVASVADQERRKPLALFVFAGPPGVGKTFMAERAAAYLDRPYRRFDMTGFTDHQQHMQLVGFEPSYKGAQPGSLTGFVESNPDAFLLFDEIEKAHLNTIQLFYQILDGGRLEDKFTGREVIFRDTVIVFTTNAGKTLYDNPNSSGISVANSAYHKKTILSALENEKNPSDGRPAFPPAICSRLGQGYPVMFNHLGIHELVRVSDGALKRVERLLQKQYFKRFHHDSRLPLFLTLREGSKVDARQLSAESEKFVKSELFKYCSLFESSRIEEALSDVSVISFEIDENSEKTCGLAHIYQPTEKARVLIVADTPLVDLYSRTIQEVEWHHALTAEEALEKLSAKDIDLILLDLWLKGPVEPPSGRTTAYEKNSGGGPGNPALPPRFQGRRG